MNTLEKRIKYIGFIFSVLLAIHTSGQSESRLNSFRSVVSNPPNGVYIVSNLAPLHISEYNLGLEYYNHEHLEIHVSLCYAPNPRKGSLVQLNKSEPYDIGRGIALKTGVDYSLFKKIEGYGNYIQKYSPFIGGRMIVSRVNERILDSFLDSSFEDYNSYNLSVALTLGSTINFQNRLSLKLGYQLGWNLIDNRKYGNYGYQPGLGVFLTAFRSQLIGTVRYQISGRKKRDISLGRK